MGTSCIILQSVLSCKVGILQSLKRSNAVAIIKLPDESKYAQINDILSELTGITDYRVNPVNRIVRVEFDPEKIAEEEIRKRLLEK